MKFLMFTLILTLLYACNVDSDPLSSNKDISFGIYFLSDSLLGEADVYDCSLDSLILQEDPWLTNNDIDFYDYSAHCIYLKEDKHIFFDNYSTNFRIFNPSLTSKPFVMVAGDTRCYVGAIHSALLSTLPMGPYIDELDVFYYPIDVIHISEGKRLEEDARHHPELKEALIEKNLFHAGLNIELISLRIIDNSNIATIQYKIKITNNDVDNLLINSADKMGSALFHYYTNGPDLFTQNVPYHFYSQYKEIDRPDSLDYELFDMISSNQTREYTIQLKGYPHIPAGKYTASMNFSNPTGIKKENRFVSDGRIWMGSIKSNDLEIIVY
jgi:hypothetical protein